jgi:hypothetical protein
MKAVAVVLLAVLNLGSVAQSAPSNECKRCADQQRACKANYSAKTCKTEFDICMKGCGRK